MWKQQGEYIMQSSVPHQGLVKKNHAKQANVYPACRSFLNDDTVLLDLMTVVFLSQL